MTTEELHGQVARAATVERELRDRIRDLEAGNINTNARAEQATARLVKTDHELVETRTKLRAAEEAKERAERERDEARKRSDRTHEWYEHQMQRADAAEGKPAGRCAWCFDGEDTSKCECSVCHPKNAAAEGAPREAREERDRLRAALQREVNRINSLECPECAASMDAEGDENATIEECECCPEGRKLRNDWTALLTTPPPEKREERGQMTLTEGRT